MKSSSFVQSLVDLFPKGAALSEPIFGGNENIYVKDCIDTGWVSSAGAYVQKFEDQLSHEFDGHHVIAMSTGTSALHLSCQLAGVKPGDHILIPNLTFVATANAPVYLGATPHLVDVDVQSLGVDPEKLRRYLNDVAEVRDGVCYFGHTGHPIRALIVMHTFGHPCRMDELSAVCEDFSIALIEDAAEALGSRYQGKALGSHGLVSALSFNGNKIITTGGGGALLTRDPDLAKKAKHLSTTAKVVGRQPGDFYHDETGYNYRLPNINAALGCAQLETLDARLQNRRKWVPVYQEALDGLGFGALYTERESCKSNYWLQTFLLSEEWSSRKNEILAQCHEHKIFVRPAWDLMSSLPMYAKCPQMNLDGSHMLFNRILNLPSAMPVPRSSY